MAKNKLHTVQTVASLRAYIAEWRDDGERLALVPTMGALHEGHRALIQRARKMAPRVCVSLFVNPTQFAPHEDLGTYPRSENQDREMLAAESVDLLYAPHVNEMYPEGDITRITVPGMGDCLEGEHRPGFFTGVATVVNKLLIQVMPHVALFGEKDFQQLQIIRRMVTDLSIPVEIEGVPTVREADGLALSSRNVYLTRSERVAAPALHRALKNIRSHLYDGGSTDDVIGQEIEKLTTAGFGSVDYLSVRNSESFASVDNIASLNGRDGRILGAARLGKARLIDNIRL